jgi:hypothetical protein
MNPAMIQARDKHRTIQGYRIPPNAYAQQNSSATCNRTTGYVQQAQQLFVQTYMTDPSNSLLLWHGLGSGKTMSSIYATSQFITPTAIDHTNYKQIVVLTPAALISNYQTELNSLIGAESAHITTGGTRKNKKTKKTIKNKTKKHGGVRGRPRGAPSATGRRGPRLPPPGIPGAPSATGTPGIPGAPSATGRRGPGRPPRIPGASPSSVTGPLGSPSSLGKHPRSPSPSSAPTVTKKRGRPRLSNLKTYADEYLNIRSVSESRSKLLRVKDPFITKSGVSYVFYSYDGDLNDVDIITGPFRNILQNAQKVVIDESQLFFSKIYSAINKIDLNLNTTSNTVLVNNDLYKPLIIVYNYFANRARIGNKNFQILALSGTPIKKRASELVILLNMLSGKNLFRENGFPDEFTNAFTTNRGRDSININRLFDVSYNLTNDLAEYRYNYISSPDKTVINERNKQNHNNLRKATNINNVDVLFTKAYGLISYFGNIPKLLPTIDIKNDCIIGYNNSGDPYFSIIESRMESNQSVIINNLIMSRNNFKGALNDSNPNSSNQYYDFFIAQSNIFAFKLDPLIGKQFTDFENILGRNAIEIHKNGKWHKPTLGQQNLDVSSFGYVASFSYFYNANFPEMMKLLNPLDSSHQHYNILKHGDESKYLSEMNHNLDNLKQYSIKMYNIIKCIRDNPEKKHLIYCEYRRMNIVFVRYLNYFLKYTNLEPDQIKTPGNITDKKYMFLTGKCHETDDTENGDWPGLYRECEGQVNGDDVFKGQLVDFFNNQPYKSGLNVVIINSASAEGITLKRLNYVHFLQIPSDMSRLYQIIGRAVRNCTHIQDPSVTQSDFYTVTPLLYLSINPNPNPNSNNTTDVEKFEGIVSENNLILPYLQMLNESAVDCYQNNVIKSQRCFSDSL